MYGVHNRQNVSWPCLCPRFIAGRVAPAEPASAFPLCPQAQVHITGCRCGAFPVYPFHPIGTTARVII